MAGLLIFITNSKKKLKFFKKSVDKKKKMCYSLQADSLSGKTKT